MKITITIEVDGYEIAAMPTDQDFEGLRVVVKEPKKTQPEAVPEPVPQPDLVGIKIHMVNISDLEPVGTMPYQPGTGKTTCAICGKTFATSKTFQKYCSEECRDKAHKQMQKVYNERYYAANRERLLENDRKRYRKTAKQETEKPVKLLRAEVRPVPKKQQIDNRTNPETIKPDPGTHREIILKSGERLCRHCKEPFKIERFEQRYCSDSCEVLHGKNGKMKLMEVQ